MPFGYLKDPLFLTCFVLYWMNRFVIKNIPHHQFFDSHFNDLICIPFLVPILLYVARKLRLRRHDQPPLVHEVMIPVLVWSVMFEIIFPQQPYWAKWLTGDPYDIMFYSAGGCFSIWFWQWWYGNVKKHSPPLSPR